MASVNSANRMERQGIWMPFMVLGYLETLRRATFYAFGWDGQGQALAVIGLIVAVQACAQYCCPSRTRKILSIAAGLCHLGGVWFFNRVTMPGKMPFSLDIFFGLPDFGPGSMKPAIYAVFCVFVVFVYGLIIFFLTSFVLERKVITEMFFAGTILLVVEIISVDNGIMGYVILNALFGIVLKSQVHLFQLESDPRVRFTAGSGVKLLNWAWTAMALGVLVIVAAMFLPAGQSKADVATLGQQLVDKVGNKSKNATGGAGGRFDLFWGKMQTFTLTGPVPAENIPVMYVRSPQPSYWRGESADVYTGAGWQNNSKGIPVLTKEFANPYSRRVKVSVVDQVFSFASAMRSPVIFTSGSPESLQIPGTLIVDGGGNFYTSEVNQGITYKVSAYVPEIEPALLKGSGYDYPADIRSRYLQLPGTTPMRVQRLAVKLTRDAANPYDKVKIIERFLSANYPYDLSVAPVPANRDVVDYFLFDLNKGYCTYHSTAMVVMLRSIGIPARWVKGFSTGVFDPVARAYEVKMSDAHAWAEVYFADYGWLPFEPTSSFVIPEPEPVQEEAAAEDEPASTERPDELSNRRAGGGLEWFPWKSTVSVLLALGGLFFYLGRVKSWRFGAADRIPDIYISLVNLLANKGYPKDEAQTPLEFAQGLRNELPEDYEAIIRITNAYLKGRYGRREISRPELEELNELLDRLSQKWRK